MKKIGRHILCFSIVVLLTIILGSSEFIGVSHSGPLDDETLSINLIEGVQMEEGFDWETMAKPPRRTCKVKVKKDGSASCRGTCVRDHQAHNCGWWDDDDDDDSAECRCLDNATQPAS